MRLSIGVLVTVLIFPIVGGITSPDIRKIRNGVLITQPTPIAIIRAEWTVIMSISAPRLPASFDHQIEIIHGAIRFTVAKGLLSRHDIASFSNRLQEVRTVTGGRLIRRRRGLLNFVGDIASSLFGVATSGDIENMKKIVKDSMTKVNKLIHYTNELTSHVRHLYEDVSVNRNQINDLTDALENVTVEVNDLRKSFMNWKQYAFSLIRIGQAIDTLEGAAYEYRRRVMTFQRRTASLELGTLTQELFSPLDLHDISRQINTGVKLIDPFQWYYHNVVVYPLWEDPTALHFMAVLPLIDDGKYVEHGIHSWPVPLNVPGHFMQVQISVTSIGLDTRTGWYFNPSTCRGDKPRVCEGNLQIDANHVPCIVSMLTSTTNSACKIELSQSNDTSSKLFKGQYTGMVLQTFGEKVKMHCEGEGTVERELANGVYVLNPSRCAYSGVGWRYRPIVAYEHKYARMTPIWNLTSIDVSDVLNQTQIVSHLKQVKWDRLQKIKMVDLAPLSAIDIDSTGINEVGEFSTTTVVIITIVICILTFIILYFSYRYGVWPKVKKCCTGKSTSTERHQRDGQCPDATPRGRIPLGTASSEPTSLGGHSEGGSPRPVQGPILSIPGVSFDNPFTSIP